MNGVILYGPPASGKDTITQALTALDDNYRLYRRLKIGKGRTTGYRMTTDAEVDRLRDQGNVIWENRRYGAVYVIDRPSLDEMLSTSIPVVHLGQVEAVTTLVDSGSAAWTVVALWCPREVAMERIANRATGDETARGRAWDETEWLPDSDLFIDTSEVSPSGAATLIHARVTKSN